jgi:hypothetical protein
LDCSLEINESVCFPDGRGRYSSPYLESFKSELELNKQNIYVVLEVSCSNLKDESKCMECLELTTFKINFLECYYFTRRFEKFIQKQKYGDYLKSLAEKKTLIKDEHSKEQPRKYENNVILNLPKPIENCAFESQDGTSCFLCKDGYFLSNSLCLPCSKGCLKCIDEFNCLLCYKKYEKIIDIKKQIVTCKYKFKLNTIDISKCDEFKLKKSEAFLLNGKNNKI